MGLLRPLHAKIGKCSLGPLATSAGAGNGPDKTSPNAVRDISFQCKKGLNCTNSTIPTSVKKLYNAKTVGDVTLDCSIGWVDF
jgi:hypothetical protein